MSLPSRSQGLRSFSSHGRPAAGSGWCSLTPFLWRLLCVCTVSRALSEASFWRAPLCLFIKTIPPSTLKSSLVLGSLGLKSGFTSRCRRRPPVPRCSGCIWVARPTTSRTPISTSWPGRQKAIQVQTSASSCGTPSCSPFEKYSQQHTSRR